MLVFSAKVNKKDLTMRIRRVGKVAMLKKTNVFQMYKKQQHEGIEEW